MGDKELRQVSSLIRNLTRVTFIIEYDIEDGKGLNEQMYE